MRVGVTAVNGLHVGRVWYVPSLRSGSCAPRTLSFTVSTIYYVFPRLNRNQTYTIVLFLFLSLSLFPGFGDRVILSRQRVVKSSQVT